MSLILITIMNRALDCNPIRRFKIPKAAEMHAKGTIILYISKAPCENGSNIGINLYTASKEKDAIDAMLPVLKKADCNRNKKNREILKSDMVSWRKVLRVVKSAGPAVAVIVCESDEADLFCNMVEA